jgi:hypothetical protein
VPGVKASGACRAMASWLPWGGAPAPCSMCLLGTWGTVPRGLAWLGVPTIIYFFFASVFHIFATNVTFSPDPSHFRQTPLSFSPASTFCFPTEHALFGILNLTNSAEIQYRKHAP